MAQLIWTEPARQDLEEIAEYYKRHDNEADYEDLRKVIDEYYENSGFDKKKEWLMHLKRGDVVKVIYVNSDCKPMFSTVVNITPKNEIELDNGRTYLNGEYKSKYCIERIVPVDEYV